MQKNKYADDLKEIRQIMDKSTRVLSLSGLSGVLAGIYALVGAYIAQSIVTEAYNNGYQDSMSLFLELSFQENTALQLLLLCGVILALALVTAYILTYRKAKKSNQKVWNKQSFRLLGSFAVPALTGAIFTLVLWQYGLVGLVAPAMLIFYGLACFNASKYTFGTVRYLGLTCIAIGLVNTQFIGYGLYFWALGFGVCHIIYGTIMYLKFDRKY
ncbi:membrane protein [Nonlabens sp. YIK11]|uniref:hypothetical protein n=1 Tax=Nonlabens sp. YIK11 TaxID=1453349 RepID=UPI0006DC8D86|nr:hypothetical protein [Nonlabens sp. YIK11]KQC34307.1 membrane protein [Nonlabens sp. YIK11]